MPANVLVIVVDGLRASALGAYGNATYSTSALDRFAAESQLFDWCFSPFLELSALHRALWVPHRSFPETSVTPLARTLTDVGYCTTLITDDHSLSEFAGDCGFAELVQIDDGYGAEGKRTRANCAVETELASIFAAAAEIAATHDTGAPKFVWVHSQGMYGRWDAPLQLQLPLLDEHDPEPADLPRPVDVKITANSDPDLIFRYANAYAAQVMVLDQCLENLLDVVDQSGGNPWLIMLIGARGFPLGEHGQIGGVDQRLYVEQVHVPWLIRSPDRLGQLCRNDLITSHYDLPAILLDLILGDRVAAQNNRGSANSMSDKNSSGADRQNSIISKSARTWTIRTKEWCLREEFTLPDGRAESNVPASSPELYVRPDDRWEANDVAKLCPDVVDELTDSLRRASVASEADLPANYSAS